MARQKQIARASALLVAGLLLVQSPFIMAQSSSSNNYQVDQTFFGSGGERNASSTNYSSSQSAGEIGIGNTSSTNYQAYAGFNTNEEPFIEFVITSNSIDLGVLSTTTTATANGTFYVRAWNASGYTVTTVSDPPKTSGGATLAGLTLATPSITGSEQFGINLAANTSPTTFGANPAQLPDSSFSFGEAVNGYGTPNYFKYVKNDVIAHATKSTSVTTYTISYIFNISSTTAAGAYTFRHVLVATGTY